jgi:hypothetical protein
MVTDAMLTSRDFHDQILVANIVAQHEQTHSLRHAVNAIASLDYYVGLWSHDLKATGRVKLDEEPFRGRLAERSLAYRILRDMAYSLKHGELTGTKPRLVKRAEQLEVQPGAFDKNVFSPDAFQTEELICIKTDNDQDGSSYAVWDLLQKTMKAFADVENELAAGLAL